MILSVLHTHTVPEFLSPSRGLYLTSIFYRDDSILVTSEDQIPIVEVEDSFSVSLMQDFLWFTKVDKSHSLVDMYSRKINMLFICFVLNKSFEKNKTQSEL